MKHTCVMIHIYDTWSLFMYVFCCTFQQTMDKVILGEGLAESDWATSVDQTKSGNQTPRIPLFVTVLLLPRKVRQTCTRFKERETKICIIHTCIAIKDHWHMHHDQALFLHAFRTAIMDHSYMHNTCIMYTITMDICINVSLIQALCMYIVFIHTCIHWNMDWKEAYIMNTSMIDLCLTDSCITDMYIHHSYKHHRWSRTRRCWSTLRGSHGLRAQRARKMTTVLVLL